ncbi:formate/nitrite transporter family protein [Ceratobasidium sp. AG-Ba]|nr:formate/nitrite transporter family protein [Ceratobasidium sp. AG-Ba]
MALNYNQSKPTVSYLPTTAPITIMRESTSTSLASSTAASSPAPPPPMPLGIQSAAAIEGMILQSAKIRLGRPLDQTFFLSVVAGIWLGFGAIGALSAACGVPQSVRTEWPILPKFLMGAVFAFALHFIVMLGGELFTGVIMVFGVGWWNRAINVPKSLVNLVTVYIGNWCGCLIMAYFMAYLTDIFDDPSSRQWLTVATLGKTNGHGWGILFLKGIGANTMVCMAVCLYLGCSDSAGKIMAIWFPVVVFVISGYEHCVANMFFLSVGLLYGAPTTIARLWFNQSAALVGNMVGGAIVIGLTLHLMNHWVSPLDWAINKIKGSSEEK